MLVQDERRKMKNQDKELGVIVKTLKEISELKGLKVIDDEIVLSTNAMNQHLFINTLADLLEKGELEIVCNIDSFPIPSSQLKYLYKIFRNIENNKED